MKRIFHHYKYWEDNKAGLYRRSCDNESQKIQKCVYLLSSHDSLMLYMEKAALEWKYSPDVFLSNVSRNRRAWLGQAACCLFCGAPEYITKIAWNRLTKIVQDGANGVADGVIYKWEAIKIQPTLL